MDIKIEKTNNGIDLLTVDIPNSPSATVIVMFKVGSRYESLAESGVAHLIEHTLFKGTEKRPNSKVISNEIESMGGYINALTSYEYTEYYIRVPNENIVQAIEILSDMIMNSKFEEEEVNKEKGVVIEEIKMYEDNPSRSVTELLYSHLWKDQPLGRSITGTVESVSNLSSKNIKDFMGRYYNSENALFIVSGNVKGVDIKKVVEDNFSLPISTESPVFIPAKENKDESSFVVTKSVEQSHICLATYGLKANDPLEYELKVANSVLGLGTGSSLYQEIREKLGAAYYVYSWTDEYKDTGIFTMQAGVDNSRVEEVIERINQIFTNLKNEPVKFDDLKRAKEVYKGYLAMELESSEEMGRWVALQYLEKGKFDRIDDVKRKIDSIKAEDIIDLMSKEIFDKLHLVMITASNNGQSISTITT